MAAQQQAMLMVPGTPAILTYASGASNNTAQTTYTFTSQAIGAASADRVVVVGAACRKSGVVTGTMTCTIGGVNAPQLVQAIDAVSNLTHSALFALAVAAGTTANIVVTYSNTGSQRCGITVWALTGTNGVATPFATASDNTNGNPMTVSQSTKPGGAIAAYNFNGSATSATFTWSGVTIDYQAAPGTNSFTGAHANNVIGGGATVSVTATGTPVEAALVTAAW